MRTVTRGARGLTVQEFRAIRERLGTQTVVARIMGVSRKTLACWEIGYHRIPLMAAVLVRLLDQYGLPAEPAGQARRRSARARRSRSSAS